MAVKVDRIEAELLNLWHSAHCAVLLTDADSVSFQPQQAAQKNNGDIIIGKI